MDEKLKVRRNVDVEFSFPVTLEVGPDETFEDVLDRTDLKDIVAASVAIHWNIKNVSD